MITGLRIDPADNVLVALRPLAAGETVGDVAVREAIPTGHKLAASDISAGASVLKYGYPIGVASQPIAAGSHVHSHNLRSSLSGVLGESSFSAFGTTAEQNQSALRRAIAQPTVDVYRRPGGRVGIRNEIWIVNTVGCVNHAAARIAEAAHRELGGVGSIDGVYAFPHPYGCSQLGDDLNHTQKMLAGLVNHPNAAAVLILGLGCENNQMKLFLEQLGPTQRERVRYFNAQDVADEFENGLDAVRELAFYAGRFKRESAALSELIIGNKCGGSDGFSGLSGNPLVGRVADRVCGAGGTVLLSEVPEMFGAERVLLQRAADEPTFDAVVKLVNNFRGYFQRYNQPIDENPSPGNKAGGITTLAEKSLGCVQKGGRTPVKQVLAYGEPARAGLGGLALVNAPGNDGVSCTAMTAAGAHLLLFTTGRGTPMGFPVPTLKIATNSDLATRKPNWIDFDAGPIARGEADLDTMADNLLTLVVDVASGRKLARNEQNGYREISIWKDGVTL